MIFCLTSKAVFKCFIMAQSSSYVPAFLSQFVTRTLLAVVPQAEKEMCGYFASFTEKLIAAAEEGKLNPKSKSSAKDTIMDIWKSVSSTLAENIQAGIDKAIVKRMNDEVKAKQKLEAAKLPTCGRRSGPNTKNPNKRCDKPCVDPTVYKDKDGNEYCLCKKHTKAANSKHSCEWEYGEEAPKKKGTKCGCRVKASAVYGRAGSWKGVTYAGLWICDKHTKKANDNLEKNEHKCKFPGSKNGKDCDKLQKHVKDDKTGSITWLSDMCAKHAKKSDKKQNQKKDADQRKKLKSGKGKDKKSKKDAKEEKKKAQEESEDEVESENEESDEEDEKDEKEEKKEVVKDNKQEKKDDKEAKKDDTKQGKRDSVKDEKKDDTKKQEKKDDKETKKTDVKKEKIIAKENFSVKGNRKPDWKSTSYKDDDGAYMNVFVDVTSGLVVYNEEDMDAKSLEEDQTDGIIPYGVWDNDSQEVTELTKPAAKYAEKLGFASQ